MKLFIIPGNSKLLGIMVMDNRENDIRKYIFQPVFLQNKISLTLKNICLSSIIKFGTYYSLELWTNSNTEKEAVYYSGTILGFIVEEIWV